MSPLKRLYLSLMSAPPLLYDKVPTEADMLLWNRLSCSVLGHSKYWRIENSFNGSNINVFTRPDEVCIVVSGGSVPLPEGPGYSAYLVDPVNPGAALQTQLSMIHSFTEWPFGKGTVYIKRLCTFFNENYVMEIFRVREIFLSDPINLASQIWIT